MRPLSRRSFPPQTENHSGRDNRFVYCQHYFTHYHAQLKNAPNRRAFLLNELFGDQAAYIFPDSTKYAGIRTAPICLWRGITRSPTGPARTAVLQCHVPRCHGIADYHVTQLLRKFPTFKNRHVFSIEIRAARVQIKAANP